jgi:hypothetical protein
MKTFSVLFDSSTKELTNIEIISAGIADFSGNKARRQICSELTIQGN